MNRIPYAREVQAALSKGETTSLRLVQQAMERIEDACGEGPRTFTRVYRDAALSQALKADEALRARSATSPLLGLPVSVKDLLDVAGEVTLAGSTVLRSDTPAVADAPVVARLKAAGAPIVGRTVMTEFAYSGLGLNPHYGTPLNPWDRSQGRIPGGSSSGAAVAVADEMCVVSVATDTGGSARIPAAFCGLTGFKPTAARIPRDGVFPLSPTLDAVGAIGPSVDCCDRLDAVLSGQAWQPLQAPPAQQLRLGVVLDYVLDDLEPVVAATFDAALSRLSAAGVTIQYIRFPELLQLPHFNRQGGFAAAESFRRLGTLVQRHGAEFDQRVAARIRRGADCSDDDVRQLCEQRTWFIGAAQSRFAGFDALVAPTVPMVAPLLSACSRDEDFTRLNLLALRNPSIVNFMDGCALSLPCQRPGAAPVGLSLMQTAHHDRQLLAAGLAVEGVLAAMEDRA
jgi:aspartyl-tRNA(Asn)/glutamyl-tRNA(Gln) amidotransferase subunit A